MYEIRPESVKTFITDKNMRLPRFQRKQTWGEEKIFNFVLVCLRNIRLELVY